MSGANGDRTTRSQLVRRWVQLLQQRRSRARGPQVVAIGGGTGLSVLLRGLKELTSNITAVVTVADDGGSSGRLRTEFGFPPMGDIRSCMVALADAEPTMARLLQYRFPSGRPDLEAEVAGHAFGNLLIAALTDITGDFEEAVREANRVLDIRGKVVPAAGQPITLHAELADGTLLEGESTIERALHIRRVWITPDDIHPSGEATAAIAGADLVVIGPGSLYTSLLPPMLIPGIREALAAASAPRVYVANVATQVGETEDYALSDHLSALTEHGMGGVVDAVLANNNEHARAPENYPAAPVRMDVAPTRTGHPVILARDVVDHDNAHRHDAHQLAATLLDIYDQNLARRSHTTETTR
jgi:uncharacterized cofD-like protein